MSRDKYRAKARAARREDALSRACTGKRPYVSEAEALDGIPSAQLAYQCKACGAWHRATVHDVKVRATILSVPKKRR